ncbi:hypothetical protein SAMN05421823_108292 [Catalinimonas alkaloidigena]|uniref:Sugar phosphate permease n=1 Tax=Catalinimonas alkaloidigena TaxID=1075417 RepID=A0A1G9NGV5_9BACT|nr:DUF5690 family protein [Catalinimonas alkaloidigena]SDL85768.1 hypothetical protein SAMN05421823_108292 [Catalinimonas alkaloidigena]
MPDARLTRWLRHASPSAFTLYAVLAAFCTYSCMYAFRKPFTAATFDGLSWLHIDYKVWLITAQVIGYMLSKFIGIKVVSEMTGGRRASAILGLIGLAGLALLGFALVPPPYNIVFLLLNGLPLGMVWGLVFSFLEGRRTTEVLGAGLCVSFIFSSGLVKSVGSYAMQDWGVSPFWMPLVTSLLFVPLLLVAVYLLAQLPPPSPEDEALRTRRRPMNAQERWHLFRTFAPGLVLLILTYTLLTAFRDFRDNFAAEIWQTLGYGDQPAIFTKTEIPVSLGVLLLVGLMVVVKDNRYALRLNHLLVLGGLLLTGASTLAFEAHWLSPPVWMTLVGFGLYLGYVPFNSVFFDRLIAAFRYVSNVGFLIYLADAFGYLGSVGVMLFKSFGYAEMSWLRFFIVGSYAMAIVGSALMLGALFYFERKQAAPPTPHLHPSDHAKTVV